VSISPTRSGTRRGGSRATRLEVSDPSYADTPFTILGQSYGSEESRDDFGAARVIGGTARHSRCFWRVSTTGVGDAREARHDGSAGPAPGALLCLSRDPRAWAGVPSFVTGAGRVTSPSPLAVMLMRVTTVPSLQPAASALGSAASPREIHGFCVMSWVGRSRCQRRWPATAVGQLEPAARVEL